ncbi:MAG: hypothetical protein KA713_18465 [Chryseotalea sp. WA131a]|nr:MAG: hypothetical protein KA713_18465 [Chryseotalea sp. WA131a]
MHNGFKRRAHPLDGTKDKELKLEDQVLRRVVVYNEEPAPHWKSSPTTWIGKPLP